MTHPEMESQVTDLKQPIDVEPIKVTFDQVRQDAADFGAWSSWQLLGPEIGPLAFRILPLETRRRRALIIVTNPVGVGAIGILIGNLGQVQNGQGGLLVAVGTPFLVQLESASAVYAVAAPAPNNGPVIVTVLDERYR
jgi:hypothetical protein